MSAKFSSNLNWSDVTPRADFLNRRQLMTGGLAIAAAAGLPQGARAAGELSPYSTRETPNSFEEITTYNNFYEFGWEKEDPSTYAHGLTIDPWTVEVAGLVTRPGRYDFADLIKGLPLEERIYRFRCVEAWSMVIPWLGFQLSGLLEKVGIEAGAKFVSFETLYRPEEMPGQKAGGLDWPYREGLRLDEAMHPLTLMATGLYGEALPKQNGAPLRLVVPWKYGFKSIKSIVKITLQAEQPRTTWQDLQPSEYGFYANVNPEVDHPRWSQATERRIGAGLLSGRLETLKFNGYGAEVAALYEGMDLKVQY